jgi:hypothetical protein
LPGRIEVKIMATYRGIPVAKIVRDPHKDCYTVIGTDGAVLAELERHAFLSFPQLRQLGVTNGKHRKTCPQIHRSPAQQSGNAVDWRTVNFAFASFASSIPITVTDFARPDPPIEHAGIRAGEVIGLRAWRVRGERLFSVYVDAEWHPGEVMHGDPEVRSKGVHAFSRWNMLQYYLAEKRVEIRFSSFDLDQPVFVVGTVALWGEIFEHEFGWRAEFAKIAGLGGLTAPDHDNKQLLEQLRRRYGMEGSLS